MAALVAHPMIPMASFPSEQSLPPPGLECVRPFSFSKRPAMLPPGLESQLQGKPTLKSSARLLLMPPGLYPEGACEAACDDLAESTSAGSECSDSSIAHLMDGIDGFPEDVEWLHETETCCALYWGSTEPVPLPQDAAQFGGLQQDLCFGWQARTSWTDLPDASYNAHLMDNAAFLACEPGNSVLDDRLYACQPESADTRHVELYQPEAVTTDLSELASLHASVGLGPDTEWNQTESADMWNVDPYQPEAVTADLSALALFHASVGLHLDTEWNQPESAEVWHAESHQPEGVAGDQSALASHYPCTGLGPSMEWHHPDWSEDAFLAAVWNAGSEPYWPSPCTQ